MFQKREGGRVGGGEEREREREEGGSAEVKNEQVNDGVSKITVLICP